MHMRLVTATLEVYSDEELDNLDPRVNVEVEDGIPAVVGIAAAIGGTKAMLKALQQEYVKHGGTPDENEEEEE